MKELRKLIREEIKKILENKTSLIVKRLKEDTEYQEFFKMAMNKFNISSPADLKDPAKKKEFFNYVDTNYKADNEMNESKTKKTYNNKKK